MNDTYIISKMNEFMHQLSGKLAEWLSRILPKLTDDWWNELVINNLSMMQRTQVEQKHIENLQSLDLSALLRVFDRNWYVISGTFFINSRERNNLKDMFEVRNTWAHISNESISKEKVIHDMDIIISLMQTLDAKNDETRDMEIFVLDVEDDKDIKPIRNEKEKIDKKNQSIEEQKDSSDIKMGDLVTLTSDINSVGAVVNVDGNTYYVLLDGSIQTFYKEQITKKKKYSQNEHVSLEEVRTALTAHEINNPGSSNLYSLNSARIDFVPYQFRPALKMIKSDSPRLLIADDVGVGKTIEAGLILKELEARGNINSVLVICPRPLVAEHKWESEMKRFDESFTQLDGKEFIQAISDTDRDAEWPERHKKTIIPYSLFGEDTVMGTEAHTNKRHKVKGLNQLDPLPQFDLVIVDEAHTIRNANTWAYAAVELFCRNAGAVVFMSATPLQNSDNDLYTLLNLLRPDIVYDKGTFITMAEPNEFVNNLARIIRTQPENWNEEAAEQINNILKTTWGRNVIQHNPNFEKVFQIIKKSEITREEKVEAISMIESLHSFNDIITRTRRREIEDICIRRTQTVNVAFSEEQNNLYDTLIDFESKALMMIHGSKSVKFMMCTIMRQAASCIYGLAPFMKDIVQRKLNQIQEDGELYEYDFELNSNEENTLFELADEIYKLSDELPDIDPKIDKLIEIIDQKQKEENNKVIIFSSFRHTLKYVFDHLRKRGFRVAQVDGSVPDEDRYKIRERFMLDRSDNRAIDVLLFSEVGCEGLDYQFCDTMINYDLPWNPMRIEQRIGRIDRRGQKSDTVKIYNMITSGTIDAVIYDRCLSKIGVFEASIGDCSKILGDISEKILNIMFEVNLTDEERKEKIEQLADNEVSKIKEMQRLEQEEKALFGFDLSQFIQSKDVQDAENEWINPQKISELVERFYENLLGDGEYILGKNEPKTLRLSSDKRLKLLDDIKKMDIPNNNTAYKKWIGYLKGDKPTTQITFDPVCAKNNRETHFFTQMHPAVLQAAKHECKNFPCVIGLSVSDENIPKGEYDFLIYVWKYVGLHPDIKLMPVCENEKIQGNILSMLQYASEKDFIDSDHESNWSKMEKIHYVKWQEAQSEYINTVKGDCNYKIEQLSQTMSKREIALRKRISTEKDEKILRMKRAELDGLALEMERHKKRFEDTISGADIRTMLLVKGVLCVD